MRPPHRGADFSLRLPGRFPASSARALLGWTLLGLLLLVEIVWQADQSVAVASGGLP